MLLKQSICCFALVLVAASSGRAQAPGHHAHSATLHRVADRSYLGVGVVELTDERVRVLKLKDDHGVEVKRVEENSPAAKAGLKENDVILEINAKRLEDVEQFIDSISETQAGSKVNMTVWRNGAGRTVTATLDSRPGNLSYDFPDAPMPPMPPVPGFGDGQFPGMIGSSARVGFEGETLSAQLAEFFGVREGVLVRTVFPRTPAEQAGLKAGDVVVKVNGTPVTNPREISGLVQTNRRKSVSFTVVRGKKEVMLSVEIASLRLPASFEESLPFSVMLAGLF